MNVPQPEEMSRISGYLAPLAQTRFTPSAIPMQIPYTSMLADVRIANAILKYRDRLRQIALHPVYLHAGQSAMPNGGIGRFAAPQLPEIIGGGLVGINL